MGAVIEEGFTIEAATGIEIGMVTDGGEVEVETGTGIHVGDEVGVEVGVEVWAGVVVGGGERPVIVAMRVCKGVGVGVFILFTGVTLPGVVFLTCSWGGGVCSDATAAAAARFLRFLRVIGIWRPNFA